MFTPSARHRRHYWISWVVRNASSYLSCIVGSSKPLRNLHDVAQMKNSCTDVIAKPLGPSALLSSWTMSPLSKPPQLTSLVKQHCVSSVCDIALFKQIQLEDMDSFGGPRQRPHLQCPDSSRFTTSTSTTTSSTTTTTSSSTALAQLPACIPWENRKLSIER
eukprot:5768357-Amphidinium_carterae.2